ncbi:putative DnaJ domain, Chaperone J-domain superfamily [Helianthus annuus]|uniref:DnaJ domain, Chaperone J-domain superfamily n=1 Tax=Helianthus annuus TaxID=4232 RepID=A0A251S8Y5_HELAN|nr:chaperone protein dnaJ C76, chloroplastic isoform X2 [Helianthus annuus]KAF5763882.1 putative DnaJ domain, Chaperone J-domain superfamily [Helianthus annuus]
MASSFAVFRLPEVFNHRARIDNLSRPTSKSIAATCCMRNPDQKGGRNYYDLLGVTVNSNPQEIKESYRRLQKKYHPDIMGQEGHEHTILLNEAYTVLMKDDLRKDYDASIGHVRVGFGGDELNMGYSSWNGPFRPQALFVDEKACIGCRECVHNASKTFVMEETTGCARVKVQFGDDDTSIEVAVESCPLDCIHWVEREDLAVLEYLNTPRPKQGYGVFNQGWERPQNVFMAAKTFQKYQKQQQAESLRKNVKHDVEPETEAQAQARESASLKLKMERFSVVWEWMKKVSFK